MTYLLCGGVAISPPALRRPGPPPVHRQRLSPSTAAEATPRPHEARRQGPVRRRRGPPAVRGRRVRTTPPRRTPASGSPPVGSLARAGGRGATAGRRRAERSARGAPPGLPPSSRRLRCPARGRGAVRMTRCRRTCPMSLRRWAPAKARGRSKRRRRRRTSTTGWSRWRRPSRTNRR